MISTPTAAPTVTRFSTTAQKASTGERKTTSSTRNVTSTSTSTSNGKRPSLRCRNRRAARRGRRRTPSAPIRLAVLSRFALECLAQLHALRVERSASWDDDHASGVASVRGVGGEGDVGLGLGLSSPRFPPARNSPTPRPGSRRCRSGAAARAALSFDAPHPHDPVEQTLQAAPELVAAGECLVEPGRQRNCAAAASGPVEQR